MRAVVEVFQAEEMPIFNQHVAVGVEEVVGQTAGLGTSATVGAAVADKLTQIAPPAVADTQGAVDEKLQRHGGLLPDFTDLLEAQFTTEDDLTKSQTFKLLHLLNGEVVALRAGMERNGRQVEVEELHVLHDEGIDTGVPAVVGQLSGAFKFFRI